MEPDAIYRGCLANDPEAWSVVQRYMHAALRKRFGPGLPREDHVQDAIAYILDQNRLQRVKAPKTFHKLMAAKAINLAKDHFRKQKIRDPVGSEEPTPNRKQKIREPDGSEGPTPNLSVVAADVEDKIFFCQAFIRIQEVVQGFEDKCRRLLTAWIVALQDGCKTIPELERTALGRELGITDPTTFRVNLHRCQKRLLYHAEVLQLKSEWSGSLEPYKVGG